MAFDRYAALIGSITGVSSLLFSGYVYREKKKQYEEGQKRYQKAEESQERAEKRLQRLEKKEFTARYHSDVRPKLQHVHKICAKRTKSLCESPTQIFEFAVWYGKSRHLTRMSKGKKEDDDDVVAVNDYRRAAVSLYVDLMDGDLETIYPADGERYNFVTLVAALYQANMQLGYENTTYKEPRVFEYTLEKIHNPDMKKKAKECRHEVSQQLKKKLKP